MKPMDFRPLVEDVAGKEKEFIEKKGLSFELRISDGDYNITGDSLQLHEVVRNLIENSLNYTPTGNISVTLESRPKTILLSVKDTGVGISPEDRPKLFKSGGRGADSLKVNTNSTGFGLAFVKGVVESHKGKVWVESEGVGNGSQFYVELLKN
jgi:signal transduction histidine kinase